MPKANYDVDSVIDTAMKIVEDLGNEGLDNDDYIPLIVTIARSAGTLLLANRMPKRDVRGNVERIIEFGRRTFIRRYMEPFPDDDEQPREQDAIEEFDRYVKPARRERGL